MILQGDNMLHANNVSEDDHIRSELDLDKALQLLEQEKYATLTELLHEAQANALNNGASTAWFQLLTAIRHLALSCYIFNKTILWHQQATQQANHQQIEIAATIRDFLLTTQKLNSEKTSHSKQIQFPEQGKHKTQQREHDKVQQLQNIISANPLKSSVLTLQELDTPLITKAEQVVSGKQRLLSVINNSPIEFVDTSSGKHNLLIYGLGTFRVYNNGKLVDDWQTRKSKSLFKYLLLNRHKPIPKELLMEVFWSDSDESSARNNLNVTIYNLRQALRNIDDTLSYILFQDDCYLLNPELSIWFDYETFCKHYQYGCDLSTKSQNTLAINEFQSAELLYCGELFEEDRYDDWVLSYRQATHNQYIHLLENLAKNMFEQAQYMECINLCRKLLSVDVCLEEMHRLLMRSYMQQGQNHLAIRQYYSCVEVLEEELAVLPSQETISLYQQICIK